MSETVEPKRPRGRPKGTTLMPDALKHRAAQKILCENKRTPLDVMCYAVERLMIESEKMVAEADHEPDPINKKNINQESIARLQQACAIARDAAPYLHSRMQTTTIKGDDAAPLIVKLVADADEILRRLK